MADEYPLKSSSQLQQKGLNEALVKGHIDSIKESLSDVKEVYQRAHFSLTNPVFVKSGIVRELDMVIISWEGKQVV